MVEVRLTDHRVIFLRRPRHVERRAAKLVDIIAMAWRLPDDVLHLGVELAVIGVEHVLLDVNRLDVAFDHLDEHRSEEHTSELQSLMRISYAVFCLKKNTNNIN